MINTLFNLFCRHKTDYKTSTPSFGLFRISSIIPTSVTTKYNGTKVVEKTTCGDSFPINKTYTLEFTIFLLNACVQDLCLKLPEIGFKRPEN